MSVNPINVSCVLGLILLLWFVVSLCLFVHEIEKSRFLEEINGELLEENKAPERR